MAKQQKELRILVLSGVRSARTAGPVHAFMHLKLARAAIGVMPDTTTPRNMRLLNIVSRAFSALHERCKNETLSGMLRDEILLCHMAASPKIQGAIKDLNAKHRAR